jgi:hypothetical protein
MSEWKPIESAPRDETVVVLMCDTVTDKPWNTPFRYDYAFGYFKRGKWWIENNGDYHDGGHGNEYECGTERWMEYLPPTHWMPLPPPPASARGEGE